MFKSISTIILASCLSFAAVADEVVVGVGIVISQDSNRVVRVDQVIPGGPADLAGVRPMEIVRAVDGVSVAGHSLEFIVSRIRGVEGTLVMLTMMDSSGRERNVSMIRKPIVYSDPCYLEGSYFMRSNSYGDRPASYISGSIGRSRVNLNVFGSFARGYIKGDYQTLNYDEFGGREHLSGWIHGRYVSWRGYNGMFNGYQSCIP